MSGLALVGAGLLGLLVGSFLNVVIYRVPRKESLVRPGSHCPHCATPILARHNVPVLSWLMLRGRCRHCQGRVSARYPLVEAGTAVMFVAVTAHFGLSLVLPAYLYLAAIAIALAVIDLDIHKLPRAIVLPAYAVGGVLLLPAVVAGGQWQTAARMLAATAVLYGLYFVLAMVYPGGMGWGDVRLAGVLGLFLGWLGWGAVWFGTLAGFLLGSVVGLALMALGRANRKTALPFGPAMLAGAFLAIFAGQPVTTWYLSLMFPGA